MEKECLMSMDFIRNNLAKDEKILLVSQTAPLIVWGWVIIWGLPALTCLMSGQPGVGFILGLIAFVVWLHYKAVEMAITNKRIIFKKGIIATNTDEIRLEKCESAKLRKGVLGVIVNYGDIIFTGTGNSSLVWKNINDPKDTRKQIEDIFETYGKK
jgi:uncharacterized membrane protein YdbT with pleckstrin-like domain